MPLRGATRVVVNSGGMREPRLRVVDNAVAELLIEGRFVRVISGYHGETRSDFEWRSETDADVAFCARRATVNAKIGEA